MIDDVVAVNETRAARAAALIRIVVDAVNGGAAAVKTADAAESPSPVAGSGTTHTAAAVTATAVVAESAFGIGITADIAAALTAGRESMKTKPGDGIGDDKDMRALQSGSIVFVGIPAV